MATRRQPEPADPRIDLVVRASRGDRGAFDVLAGAVVDRLYAVARLILRDVDRAEDAVQEALVRCWRDLPSLREPERFYGWLHRLLVHAVHDEFRSGRRHQAKVTLLRIEPAEPDASTALIAREELRRGFERLTVEQRSIVVLRLYLGLSIQETADCLGIPAGTAKSRLHYATEAMRLALEADVRPRSKEVSA